MSAVDQEERAQAAIRDIKDGCSVRGSCTKWNVSRSYVIRRLDGALTRKEANKTFQVLSPDQESQLASWAIGQARLGLALPIMKFNDIAQRMLMESGTDHRLGQGWHRRFFARNPDILSARSQAAKYIRANGVTDANIRIFFDRLNAPEIRDIPRERFYTNNELGYCEELGQDHHVTNARKLSDGAIEGTWITFFECVSGSGKALSPLISFQGPQAQRWRPDESHGMFEHWCFKYFPEDSANHQIAMVWLQDVFIPHVRVEHGDEWVVLICDAHYYQGNDDFLWLCLTNKIWVVSYEPNCSHVVEPMQAGVATLLKSRLNDWDSQNAKIGQTHSDEDVLKAYKRARDAVFTVRGVRSGWKAAGIFPRDVSKPLSSKLATPKEPLIVRRTAEPSARQRARAPNPTTDLTKTPVLAASDDYDYWEIQQLINDIYPSSTYAGRIIAQHIVRVLNYYANRLADLKAQTRALKAKLNGSPKKSRKPVKRVPTQKTIRTPDARRVKRQLRGRAIYEGEAINGGASNARSVDSETDEDSDEPEDGVAV